MRKLLKLLETPDPRRGWLLPLTDRFAREYISPEIAPGRRLVRDPEPVDGFFVPQQVYHGGEGFLSHIDP